MGLMDFIKGEYIEIVEWTDDTRNTLTHRFADADKAIKNGAQLIVRESQMRAVRVSRPVRRHVRARASTR